MALEDRNRDVIRAAAKLAGGVNVSYKTKAENIAFLREQGVVDAGPNEVTGQIMLYREYHDVDDVIEDVDDRQDFGFHGDLEDDEFDEVDGDGYARRPSNVDDIEVRDFGWHIAVNSDGQSEITIVDADGETVIRETEPHYGKVASALLAGDDPRAYLDTDTITVAMVSHLSERAEIVTTDGETVLHIDGEPVHGKMVDQFVRYWLEDRDTGNLLAFLERVKSNPLPVAETNLYSWGSQLTIDEDGYFVGFKSVVPDEGGKFKPGHNRVGPGEVNGEAPKDRVLRQTVGDVVTIDRELVLPGDVCGVGLHVGTWDYARTFNGPNSVVMEVRVDPADIVNVPRSETGKLRCTRYEVVAFHDANGVLTHHEPEPKVVEDVERAVDEALGESEQAGVVKGFFQKLFRRGDA